MTENQDEKELSSRRRDNINPLEKQLNEAETGKLSEKEFRMMVKITQDLRKRTEKMQGMFTKESEALKTNTHR